MLSKQKVGRINRWEDRKEEWEGKKERRMRRKEGKKDGKGGRPVNYGEERKMREKV